MVYQSEKTIAELGDKLSAEDKSKLESALEKVKTALKGTDIEEIKRTSEELTQAFYAVSEKIYSQQGGQTGASPSGPNPGGDSNTGAGYFDADYEVVDDDNNKK
jgi:molecular chaperone DnaK